MKKGAAPNNKPGKKIQPTNPAIIGPKADLPKRGYGRSYSQKSPQKDLRQGKNFR